MSQHSQNLFQLLPEIYRIKDNYPVNDDGQKIGPGHLELFLEGCDDFLSTISRTISQLQHDSVIGEQTQEWVLPYLGQLLDVQMVSSDLSSRQQEVAKSISWRQQKGTGRCVDDIIQTIGGFAQHTVVEGWQTVITSPSIGRTGITPATTPAITSNGKPMIQRTVDSRTPDWQNGHYHPKRCLISFSPTEGFFDKKSPRMQWHEIHNLVAGLPVGQRCTDSNGCIEIEKMENRVIIRGLTPTPVKVLGVTRLHGDYTLENLWINSKLIVDDGHLQVHGSAMRRVEIHNSDKTEPVLSAHNSLFKDIRTATGLCRLVHCTVLATTHCQTLQASEVIFRTLPFKDDDNNYEHPVPGCIRYSVVPEPCTESTAQIPTNNNVIDDAFFITDIFGQPGCAMLHPTCAKAIRHGAENGGEIGCYNHKGPWKKLQALHRKLKDFLPLGTEAVFIMKHN